MKNPILNLKNVALSFGTKTLFGELSFSVYIYDRICLVGRNGEGKSSLLKLIAGLYDLDDGEIWKMPGTVVGYLSQAQVIEKDMTVLDFVLSEFKQDGEYESKKYLADMVIEPLKLDKNKKLSELSGGLLRRAALARTLVLSPEILLLDEPTNHLDIHTIEWLEGYINNYRGAVICISHDRTFLKNISNKTFWLDRGKIKVNNAGYDAFEEWSIEVLEAEQRELDRASRKLEIEEQWKVTGVTARRKRNQRRLADLYNMREKVRQGKNSRAQLLNKIRLDPLEAVLSSKLVAEFDNVAKKMGAINILEDFSFRLMRGDKIGIIGNNGTGKSTFLKLLIKEAAPDSGYIRLGKTITVTYADQSRADLDPDETLWRILCHGGDYIQVGDKPMHVVSYLKNFLFDPKQARDKVSTLSGGQANRLLLAKALANPGSLLILDEPTNDLDIDTLDMIQEILSDYTGTLIVVSHDRDFLDRLVTKTLLFNGNAEIEEFYGSYNEYIKQKNKTIKRVKATVKEEVVVPRFDIKKGSKLSYSLQRELDLMPRVIADLEEEIESLEVLLHDPLLYANDLATFNEYSQKLAQAKGRLAHSWERWGELDGM